MAIDLTVDVKQRKSVKEALSLEYTSDMYKRKIFYSIIKRLFDFFSSLLGIIILSPIFLIVIILKLLIDHQAPFYAHKRVGKNGKEFKTDIT